jgi:hypothetical protein
VQQGDTERLPPNFKKHLHEVLEKLVTEQTLVRDAAHPTLFRVRRCPTRSHQRIMRVSVLVRLLLTSMSRGSAATAARVCGGRAAGVCEARQARRHAHGGIG